MKTSIFLDSGAYSAWSLKKDLLIEDYIEYIKEHEDSIDVYANLDAIGDVEKTWQNQEAMERAGLTPLPVYHVNEPLHYLHRCLEYDYFAIGGMAKVSSSILQYQMDTAFNEICPASNDHFPLKKVHGFGCSTPKLIVGYPWFSVDSSSWVKYGLFGIVLIPKFFHNKPIYNRAPMTITMSNRSKGIGEAEHFANLPPMEQERINNYFAEKNIPIGKSEIYKVEPNYLLGDNEVFANKEKTAIEYIIEPGLVNNHKVRDRANLMYYLDLETYQPAWPWRWHKKSGRLF